MRTAPTAHTGMTSLGAGTENPGECGWRRRCTMSTTSISAMVMDTQMVAMLTMGTMAPRPRKIPTMLAPGTKLRHVRLTGGHAERQMEALLIIIPPSFVAPTTAREGEGFYYVLEGKLTMTLGKRTRSH